MNKTPFTYQRWHLRCFCAGFISFFAALALWGLWELIGLPYKFFVLSYLLYAITERVITPFYFKLTKHSKWFICEGNYWVEDGTVFIETRKKTYSINNVASIYGKTVSYDNRHNKSGRLIIDYNNKTLRLVSIDEEKVESFSDSGLYGLFETIRENNPELEKGEFTHFWYCLKE